MMLASANDKDESFMADAKTAGSISGCLPNAIVS
jgi:hypothetical protein